jgi:hypothetical protein
MASAVKRLTSTKNLPVLKIAQFLTMYYEQTGNLLLSKVNACRYRAE